MSDDPFNAVWHNRPAKPTCDTPAVLAELAREGLFDLTAAFCPAGKLSMAEAKAREASGMSAFGQDPKGLEAKPASPTAGSGDAQNTPPNNGDTRG